MKRATIVVAMVLALSFLITGCGKKITLDLSFGQRIGTYSGEMEKGIPNGNGKFTTKNTDGTGWTYEGNWKKGHFEGEGKTTWESGQTEIGTYLNDSIVPMKGDEIKTLYTSPENFKNHVVEIVGKVFNTPEYSDSSVSFQMWGDFENSDKNTIVHVMDANFKVKADDYVKIIGTVGDVFKGKNAFGAEVTAPTITAKKSTVLSYQEAVVPTLKEVPANQTVTQLGYSVTVSKVEFAEKETRVYVKVENNGNAKFNLYSFNAKIVQSNKQFEEQDNWNTDYPKIQTDLLPSTSAEGIIAFPALEIKPFKILFDCSSDNWREDLKNFEYDIQF